MFSVSLLVLSGLCIFFPVCLESGEFVYSPSDVAACDRVTVSRGLAEPVRDTPVTPPPCYGHSVSYVPVSLKQLQNPLEKISG